jgi:UDP-N-acetyl-D-mannosaminuronic acid dehydrogenase
MNHLQNICCNDETSLIDVLVLFDKAKNHNLPSGIVLVVNDQNVLKGTITEGDVRRAILQHKSLEAKTAEFMEVNPIFFDEDLSIVEILTILPHELRKRKRKANRYLSKIVLVNKLKQPVRILDYHELWEQKVASHRHLVIIGMGYVGLTMAVVLADAGFMVTGVEVDEKRYEMLSKGESYIHEVGLQELLKKQLNRNFFVSRGMPEHGDVFIISVGTPVEINKSGNKIPVMDYLNDACEKIGHVLQRGNLVILRSTVPIGTCRNVVKNKLEEISGLKCGVDFYLSFAPERTAEGKALKELRSLPQIIGGYNNDSLEATAAIFRDITPTIVKVESIEAAEMAKLINNTFRDYVFAYANQMSKVASKFNINVFDVIKAANEGYIRDPVPLPSPGVGGPCLTKDPHIFASVADQFSFDGQIFSTGRKINESMHELVFQNVIKHLEASGKSISDCSILVCGLAFKGNPETGDIRNSTSIEIAMLFKGRVKNIYGYDAVASYEEISNYDILPVSIPDGFINMDAVLFLNNHKSFEKLNIYDMVMRMNKNPIIFDGWNLFRHEDVISVKPSTYLGLSFSQTSIN